MGTNAMDANAYIAQLNPMEQKILQIARSHLETSFSLDKSIGFQEWQAKQQQAKQQEPKVQIQEPKVQIQEPKVQIQEPKVQIQEPQQEEPQQEEPQQEEPQQAEQQQEEPQVQIQEPIKAKKPLIKRKIIIKLKPS
jgi:hypothetical protein